MRITELPKHQKEPIFVQTHIFFIFWFSWFLHIRLKFWIFFYKQSVSMPARVLLLFYWFRWLLCSPRFLNSYCWLWSGWSYCSSGKRRCKASVLPAVWWLMPCFRSELMPCIYRMPVFLLLLLLWSHWFFSVLCSLQSFGFQWSLQRLGLLLL